MILRSLLTRRTSLGLNTRAWTLPPDPLCKPSYLGRHGAGTVTAASSIHTWSDVSPRDLASLEDRLCQSVGTKVIEPILKKDLGSLKWMDRRIVVATEQNAAKLSVRIPTQLYPSKDELLKQVLKITSREVQDWNAQRTDQLDDARIQVELVAAKPVPAMSKYVENHEELLKQLGPGLVNVSQYLAVYSCKVRTFFF